MTEIIFRSTGWLEDPKGRLGAYASCTRLCLTTSFSRTLFTFRISVLDNEGMRPLDYGDWLHSEPLARLYCEQKEASH
jgi:hypothetical protein